MANPLDQLKPIAKSVEGNVSPSSEIPKHIVYYWNGLISSVKNLQKQYNYELF